MSCWISQGAMFAVGTLFGLVLIPGVLAAWVFLGEWFSSDDKRYRQWLDGSAK